MEYELYDESVEQMLQEPFGQLKFGVFIKDQSPLLYLIPTHLGHRNALAHRLKNEDDQRILSAGFIDLQKSGEISCTHESSSLDIQQATNVNSPLYLMQTALSEDILQTMTALRAKVRSSITSEGNPS